MAKNHKKPKKDSKQYDKNNSVETEYLREWRVGSRWNEQTPGWYMECKMCGQWQRCGHTAAWIICTTCTSEMVPWDECLPKSILRERNKSSQKPQGWHFMKEYVDKDGNVFHKGEEQPKLKGTLKPTIIKKKKRLSKKEKERIKQDIAKDVYDLKQQLKKARWKKDKYIIEREIKKKLRGLK